MRGREEDAVEDGPAGEEEAVAKDRRGWRDEEAIVDALRAVLAGAAMMTVLYWLEGNSCSGQLGEISGPRFKQH